MFTLWRFSIEKKRKYSIRINGNTRNFNTILSTVTTVLSTLWIEEFDYICDVLNFVSLRNFEYSRKSFIAKTFNWESSELILNNFLWEQIVYDVQLVEISRCLTFCITHLECVILTKKIRSTLQIIVHWTITVSWTLRKSVHQIHLKTISLMSLMANIVNQSKVMKKNSKSWRHKRLIFPGWHKTVWYWVCVKWDRTINKINRISFWAST